MTSDGQTASLTVSADEPDGLLAAIGPDVGAIPGDTSVETSIVDGALELRIEGPDLPSLRAAVGTWTKLIAVASAADRTGDEPPHNSARDD